MTEEKNQELLLYGYQALEGIPPAMDPWSMSFEPPLGSFEQGRYVLVGVEPAWIEMHHQVEVIDEHGDPLPGVWVIFGFPGGGGPEINLKPRVNRWSHSPAVLIGNAQRTNRMGYAEHTFGSGGEDIWVWDVQGGVLELPSPIIRGCNWVGTEVGAPFIHTGVKLTFQRRRNDVEPRGPRLDRIEASINALLAAKPDEGRLAQIEEQLKSFTEQQKLHLENLELRLKLLEAKLGDG